jgi:hypothetical protein
LRDLFGINDEDMDLYYVEGDDYYFRPFYQTFRFPFESTKQDEDEKDDDQ